jgi:hypothetical protein
MRADLLLQEIKNISTQTDANDLELVFTMPVEGTVRLVDQNGKEIARANNVTGTSVSLSNFASAVGAQKAAGVEFQGAKGTKIDKTMSTWTAGGRTIVDALAFLGTPPEITFTNGLAVVQLTNSENFPLRYSNIQLYLNNVLSNFTIDNFLFATGSLVPGIPTDLTLTPGESVSLSFGAVRLDTYQLVTLTAAPLSDLNNAFQLAAAAAIPEPSTFWFCSLAVLFFAIRAAVSRSHEIGSPRPKGH